MACSEIRHPHDVVEDSLWPFGAKAVNEPQNQSDDWRAGFRAGRAETAIRLQNEVERALADFDRLREVNQATLSEATIEIERLRAALQQIVDIETEYEGCAELARGALGEPKS